MARGFIAKVVSVAAFSTLIASAQMPMPAGGVCRPGHTVQDLNLSEAQQKQITSICKDSFKKVFDLREAVRKSETELQAAFDESPVDQAKSNAAIEHLVAARAELFRGTSQMDLKIRTVLTDEQWQELKKRQHRGGPGGRPGGPDWRRGGPSPKGPPPTGQPPQKN